MHKSNGVVVILMVLASITVAENAFADARGNFIHKSGLAADCKIDKTTGECGENAKEPASEQSAPASLVSNYPNAKRVEPVVPKTKIKKEWDALVKATNAKDPNATISAAQAVMASPNASINEKSEAANQITHSYLSLDKSSYTSPIDYAKQAIDLNGLSNNLHYQLMFTLSQMQMAEKKYADALSTMDRFSKETTVVDDFTLLKNKGNALYRLEKYSDAIVYLNKAYAMDKGADPNIAIILMDAYNKTGQAAAANKIAEDVAKSVGSADSNDKNAQTKQLLVLANAKQYDKAAKIFDELYASGQITQMNEYEAGYVSFSHIEGKEDRAVKIINEGMAKGVIQPNAQVYNILGQSNYYSNQPKLAIDAWTKGAALSKDGEQNLSLARVYIEEERYSEGKAAAQQALSKGIKDRDEAKQLIAEADAALGH